MRSYPVLDPVSQAYPEVQGRSPTCYSPVRHSCTPASRSLTVRLACVKHAASVRPEPGSNPPSKTLQIRRITNNERPKNLTKNKTNKPPHTKQCMAWLNIQKLHAPHPKNRRGQTKNAKQKHDLSHERKTTEKHQDQHCPMINHPQAPKDPKQTKAPVPTGTQTTTTTKPRNFPKKY